MPVAEEWTKLTSLPSKYEADLLAGRLQEEGIPTQTTKAPGDSAAWLNAYGDPRGLFEVHVPAAKKGDAGQLLRELSSSEQATIDRSFHRPIQLVGRGLLLVALIGLIAAFVRSAGSTFL
jgi:hypothetical protein